MNRTRIAAAAIIAAALSAGSATAGLNDPPAGRRAPVAPAAADKTLGTALMFAVVNADGGLARGTGVLSASKVDLGAYVILFERSVTTCGHYASVGLSGSTGASPPGFTTVVGRIAEPGGIFLQTFDKNGDPADRGFHVQVLCTN